MTVPRVMLDTNIVSHIIRYPELPPALRLTEFEPGEVIISSVVLAELLFGVTKANSTRLRNQVEFVLELVVVTPFDAVASHAYATVRTNLERLGLPIGPLDTLIAAHAIALELSLATANVREFSRVSNLRVENWLD